MMVSNNNLALRAAQSNDPNIPQKMASDPEASVWVNASAGTGKTKVLTDRVLRLLLPDADGQRRASLPTRILCITFTKAAASEMASRINKILATWAVMDDSVLFTDLEKLLGHAPSAQQIKTARRLFSDVIDAPGGLKIMTIHAFCQSVLGRFPLEANIPPNFSVIDEEEAKKLVNMARRKILSPAALNNSAEMTQLMDNLAAEKNEGQVNEVLMSVLSERLQLRRALQDVTSRADLYAQICASFDCPLELDMAQHCPLDDARLWALAKLLQTEGKSKEQGYGAIIQNWLELPPAQRLENYGIFLRAFVTADGNPYKGIPTKELAKNHPHLENEMAELRDIALGFGEKIKAQRCAALTADLLYLGHFVLDEYKRAKELQGVLDYEDLIFKTHDLLRQPETARWVLFKLDGGLDHLLIDEAQDTNPEQWEIIDSLAAEFFSGQSARDEINRTIFTVGDEKQSIYSFQRADPKAYQKMRHHFRGQIEQAEKKWADIAMVTSFRSTRTVLQLVDECFAPDEHRQTLGPSYDRDALQHFSHRALAGGRAELWPLIEADTTRSKIDAWQLPLEIKHTQNPQTDLAEQIAQEIKNWLRTGRILPSKNRPVHAGDILILVRNRTQIVGALMRALRKYNIPVAGVDRLALREQIAIMDLIALAQISILQEDDLSLASLLKSPFIGLSEEQLFELAHNRGGQSLWQRLKNNETYSGATRWIKRLARIARKERPYEFFSVALNTPCPAGQTGLSALTARLGRDIDEPLSEFLNLSIHYEQDNLPSVQGFLNWFENRDTTIKRQMEEAGREVRIMTVHSSKGLQAPIVFMPDTLYRNGGGPREDNNLLWPNRTGYDYPLYAPRKDDRSAAFNSAKDDIDAKERAEYNRLLYVALTRAEDEIYICGAGNAPKNHRDSWYHVVEDAFQRIDHHEDDTGRLIIQHAQEETVAAKTITPQNEIAPQDAPPSWMFAPPPEEALPPRPLAPSRPSEDEPAYHSPLDADNSYRFLRGNVTHKLLELLPSLKAEARLDAARLFVGDAAHGLSEKIQDSIIHETMNVLNHPEFAPVFGAGSMSEVPLTGLINNQVISAQIDRMLITDDEVFIVDFKTNRPSPSAEEDVPAIYKKQLKSYADIMRHIHPDKTIRTALLWTDRAALMEITV